MGRDTRTDAEKFFEMDAAFLAGLDELLAYDPDAAAAEAVAPKWVVPKLVPVESDEDVVAALMRVAEYRQAEGPAAAAFVHAQSVLIADYEARTAPPDKLAEPACRAPLLAAIKARIAEKGLRPHELRRLFLGQDWEVLNGRRPLSAAMMWGVARALDLPIEALLASRAPPPGKRARARRSAVPVAKSVAADHVVCLECGARRTFLRRHIGAVHGMDEMAYRARWGLDLLHPLTAPAYSGRCSDRARAQGLGGDTSRFRARRKRRRG